MNTRNALSEMLRIGPSVAKRAGVALSLLGLLLAASVAPATAQLDASPRFRIPFAFMARGSVLPAGEYKLSRLESRVLSLQRVDGSGAVVLRIYPSKTAKVPRPQLVFDNYFGRQHVLSCVRGYGDQEFTVVPRKGEREATKGVREVMILAEEPR